MTADPQNQSPKLDGVIRGFIVEKDDEGFSAPEMKGKHSLKASVTSELVFQDCKIPKDRILPGVKGLRGPFSCLNNARYGISWGAIGSAQACFDSAKEYSLSRNLDILYSKESILPPEPFNPESMGVWIQVGLVHPLRSATSLMYM